VLAISPRNRSALSALALVAFAGAFVATPLAARSSAVETAAAGTTTAAPDVEARTVAVILPRRDPFTGGLPTERAAATPSAAGALGALPSLPAALGVLPANAGARGAVLPFASTARVTAIVTGPHPFALVDEGGSTRVVGIGERIGTETIAAIGADGVRLASGQTLRVASADSTLDRPPGAR
jgi:hypothetical protein